MMQTLWVVNSGLEEQRFLADRAATTRTRLRKRDRTDAIYIITSYNTGQPRCKRGFPRRGAGMFVLAEMQDVIRIEPHQFKFDMQRQIVEGLNKKLANKVHATDKCIASSFIVGQTLSRECAWL